MPETNDADTSLTPDLMLPLTRESIQALPKIDLHRHLEGSLRLETLLEIAQEYHLDLPRHTAEALRPLVQVTNDPPDHEVFLGKFQVLRQFYQSPELIKRLVYEVVADAAQDNVHYLELRFSPQALTRVNNHHLADAAHWVIEATDQASRDFPIEVGLIITLVRHDPLAQAKEVAEVAFSLHEQGIVGIDLAGDEVKFPPGPFIPIFQKAREVGLGITIHAGEWTSSHGVRQAVEELDADRIGHGVRVIDDLEVARLVKDRGVALEVCLTSNVQTGVVGSIQQHPLTDLLDLGLLVTLNTDDPTVSNCTLSDEYLVAADELNLGYAGLHQLIFNAVKTSFLPDDGRKRLAAHFNKVLPPVSKDP